MEAPKQGCITIIMLSIEKCNKVLNKKEKKYSNEQVKVIRDYLYQLTIVIDELKSKNNE